MREAKVNQKPGPVLVTVPAPSLSISCFTSAKSAISIRNAIKLNAAAKNASKDAMRVTTTWVESEARNAINVTAAATGWTASPRVHDASIVATSDELPSLMLML